MALTQQKTGSHRTTVRVDFPTLPPTPSMSIATDQRAMDMYGQSLSAWYETFKSVTLDKLNALAGEIDKLKT